MLGYFHVGFFFIQLEKKQVSIYSHLSRCFLYPGGCRFVTPQSLTESLRKNGCQRWYPNDIQVMGQSPGFWRQGILGQSCNKWNCSFCRESVFLRFQVEFQKVNEADGEVAPLYGKRTTNNNGHILLPRFFVDSFPKVQEILPTESTKQTPDPEL